jgi:hypothetical protein
MNRIKLLVALILLITFAISAKTIFPSEYVVEYDVLYKNKVISTNNIFIAENPIRNKMYNRVKHIAKLKYNKPVDIHINKMGYQ